MTITLILILLAQHQPNDLDFALAVESSIHNFGTIKTLDETMPASQARLIRSLGCGRYDCRELAGDAIRSQGHAAFRSLVWAGWHSDPEIRTRAESLIRELTRCPHCSGSGTCPQRIASRWLPCEGCMDDATRFVASDPLKCLVCDGRGDVRSGKPVQPGARR